MKIVIKIPEDTYKDIIKNGFIYDEDNEVVTHAIKNGTPLPEGHGRLIDISEYEKYFNTAITYDDGNRVHVVYTNTIPTIIEGSDSE